MAENGLVDVVEVVDDELGEFSAGLGEGELEGGVGGQVCVLGLMIFYSCTTNRNEFGRAKPTGDTFARNTELAELHKPQMIWKTQF